MIQRCVSYYRNLHSTAALEGLGVNVINCLNTGIFAGNKLFTHMLLKKHGVPTPNATVAFSKESAIEALEEQGYPKVIKPVIGSWGRGVMPLRDKDTAEAIMEIRDINDGPHDRIYYLQELIKRPPRDIRVITVGDNVT